MSLREDAEEDPGSEQEIKRRMLVCMKEEGLRKAWVSRRLGRARGSEGSIGKNVARSEEGVLVCELGGLEPKCLGLREDCEARSRGGETGEDAWT